MGRGYLSHTLKRSSPVRDNNWSDMFRIAEYLAVSTACDLAMALMSGWIFMAIMICKDA